MRHVLQLATARLRQLHASDQEPRGQAQRDGWGAAAVSSARGKETHETAGR